MTKAITRARATPAETAERVEYIAGIMRRGEWVRGVTGGQLAQEWGVTLALVGNLTGEASRIVAREVTDPGTVQPTVATALAITLERAMEAKDHRSVIAAADTWSRIVGARAPERHEHAVVVAQYEALPPKQRAAWLRERAAAMIAEADRLDADNG